MERGWSHKRERERVKLNHKRHWYLSFQIKGARMNFKPPQTSLDFDIASKLQWFYIKRLIILTISYKTSTNYVKKLLLSTSIKTKPIALNMQPAAKCLALKYIQRTILPIEWNKGIWVWVGILHGIYYAIYHFEIQFEYDFCFLEWPHEHWIAIGLNLNTILLQKLWSSKEALVYEFTLIKF